MTTNPLPSIYPKKLTLKLEMEIEVYDKEEEHYFTTNQLDESYLSDLREAFFNSVSSAALLSINGVKLPLY